LKCSYENAAFAERVKKGLCPKWKLSKKLCMAVLTLCKVRKYKQTEQKQSKSWATEWPQDKTVS